MNWKTIYQLVYKEESRWVFMLKYFFLSTIIILITACSNDGIYFENSYLIENISIIHPIEEAENQMTLVISENKIINQFKTNQVKVSQKNIIYDGYGKYIMPGLWDAHIHFAYETDLANSMPDLFLAHGVTSLRDTGGEIDFVNSFKQKSLENPKITPRVKIAGPLVDGNYNVYDGSSPNYPELSIRTTSVIDLKKQVQILIDKNIDFLKAYEMLSPAQFEAIAEIADTEIRSAHGVEDMDTAQQISRLPPGQKGLKRKPSQKRKRNLGKRKRSQKQSTRRMRQNDANAGNTVGGSRLVLNKSIKSYAGRNDCFAERKCLPDAIIALLDEGTKKQGGELYAVMPKERDTSPNDLKDALSCLGLCLKRVTREYKKVDCLPSYLLLKEEKCKLVIHVNLTDADGNAISHFIAWDGTTVFDHPFNLRINKTTDRMSESNSQQAFEKLFTRSYLAWNITSVFRLCIDNRPSV